jgi:hypothetical protein
MLDTRGGHANILATEEFGGVPKTIDLRPAPAEIIRLINARRSELGARKLEVDSFLTESAQKGAALFFQEPYQTQQQVVEGVNTAIARPPGGRASPVARRIRAAQSFLVPAITLQQAVKLEPLYDPAARYIGVAVSQGTRPETGPNTIAVLMVVGWPR